MRRFPGTFLIGMLMFQIDVSLVVASPKIAIVGGGIGGASTSHFLTELFDGNLDIDLFEANKLGGRLATEEIFGAKYESGGAVIHNRNLLMKRFAQLLGLDEKEGICESSNLGIWNKEEFVFQTSYYQVVSLAKMIYRYGLETFRFHSYVNSVLDDFENIYQVQDKGVAFLNVTSLLSAMNVEFPKMLEISSKDSIEKLGYSSRLIDELVEAAHVVNYGQDTNIQSFVGFVSVAGIGTDLWSVKGGNKEVPKHLIYRNKKVKVIPSVVKKIIHMRNNDSRSVYEIHYGNNGSSGTLKSVYDIVILATPLTRDQKMLIEFVDFPENTNLNFPGMYQTTFATFVYGDMNPKYFKLEDPINQILSCDPVKTIISSVGILTSVDGNCSSVWKIFSREPIEQKVIESMFTKVKYVKSVTWKAYPKYTGTKLRMDFKIHNSLYYVNAIEAAASAMEMSAIGGRNVAILAFNEYNNFSKGSFDESESKEFKNHKEL